MTLSDLDFLLSKTEDQKDYIRSLDYDKSDIRHSFYGLFYSITYDYYLGHISLNMASLISEKKVFFDEKTTGYSVHYARLREIQTIEELYYGFIGSLNRNLILSTWTTFELSISDIFDAIIDRETKTKIILDLNSKIVKATSDLNQDNKQIVLDHLVRYSFVPIVRKFRAVVNKDKYDRDYKSDVKLLEFLSSYRNCMLHSNGIYNGKNFTYEYNEATFSFENGKMFREINSYPYVYWDLAYELKAIFTSLHNSLDYKGVIEYKSEF